MVGRRRSTNPRDVMSRSRQNPALLVACLIGLMAWGCDGDTLYDPTTVPPPGSPNGEPPAGSSSVALTVHLDAPDRIELTDSMSVRIEAWDPAARSGIAQIGYAVVIRDDASGDEIGRTADMGFSGAVGDTITASFTLHPDWVSVSDLPAAYHLELYGWARSGDGQCQAAVPEDTSRMFACRSIQVGGTDLTVGTAQAATIPLDAVPGRTTPFAISQIVVGDLQVDTLRERAYLSNRLSNRLHVFQPGSFEWQSDVLVGSEPWGLHLNRTGDTLLVANSGGTSVSRVSLSGTASEAVSRRVQTRNTALFEIELDIVVLDSLSDGTVVSADTLMEAVRFLDFSDRPQYVAEDGSGRILYSTRPTGAAPLGTVRVVTNEVGWEDHETNILARIPKDVVANEGTVTVLNADSVVAYWGGAIEVWDHRPGFPSVVVRSGIQRPLNALRTMAAHPDSDVEFLLDSSWELDAVSFADTTYVATSRDRSFVAFGDGGQLDVGRIVLWHAPTADISRRLTVADLVNNASERVRALELNRDGSLGVARGSFGTYFFADDLRLRGTVPELVEGGGGAALHPDHPNTPAPSASSPTTVAFTVSGDRMIRILDTVHYTLRGQIPVRDPIAGPLRVTPPLPSDNGGQGRSCAEPDCVVAKVFAVTEGGGLLVVDVHASDIETLP